jgi:hypothetical protein
MAQSSHSVRDMSPQWLDRRVAMLEEHVNALNELPARIDALENELRAEMAAIEGRLRTEIRTGDEETRRQMRVLHEEVISRIALLQECISGRSRPRSVAGPRSKRR